MGEYTEQLGQAHELLLSQHLAGVGMGSPLMPGDVEAQLRASSSRLESLRQWVRRVSADLGIVFGRADGTATTAEERMLAIEPPAVDPPADDVGAFAAQCGEEVPLGALLSALRRLQEEHRALEARLAREAAELFVLRSERAAAAGERAALEFLAGDGDEAALRRETVAGTAGVMRDVEKALWRDPTLRRQADLALIHEFDVSRQRLLEAASPAQPLADDFAAAERRLRAADVLLRERGRGMKQLVEEREDLADMMRKHLKSVLLQCMPPSAAAQRSRYARFSTSSPASSAVQLMLEASAFIGRSTAETIPSLLEVLRLAAVDIHRGAAPRDFQPAPSLARWQEWMPEPFADGQMLGFQAFMGRYEAAAREHDRRLAEGGRLAALFATWSRWSDAMRAAGAPAAASIAQAASLAHGTA